MMATSSKKHRLGIEAYTSMGLHVPSRWTAKELYSWLLEWGWAWTGSEWKRAVHNYEYGSEVVITGIYAPNGFKASEIVQKILDAARKEAKKYGAHVSIESASTDESPESEAMHPEDFVQNPFSKSHLVASQLHAIDERRKSEGKALMYSIEAEDDILEDDEGPLYYPDADGNYHIPDDE
jgi:hypothetical protein